MEKKDKKIERWTKSTLLERGWTQKSIKELLPPPELVDNPHYKCASPMNLWDSKIVKQKERTKKFKEYAEKKAKRQEAISKSIDKRKDETFEMAKNFSLEIKRIDLDKLKRYTLNSKYKWYMYLGQDWKADNVYNADERTLLRWEENYIRHNLSNYDEEINKLFGKIGKQGAYETYKTDLMNKIFEVYPELAKKEEEICNRNIARFI